MSPCFFSLTCGQAKIPLLVARAYGLIGYIRVVVHAHDGALPALSRLAFPSGLACLSDAAGANAPHLPTPPAGALRCFNRVTSDPCLALAYASCGEPPRGHGVGPAPCAALPRARGILLDGQPAGAPLLCLHACLVFCVQLWAPRDRVRAAGRRPGCTLLASVLTLHR